GNHEFDFGTEIFLKRMGEAHFPVYAANLRARDGNPLAKIQDQTMTAFGDVQVGIIGLTAEDSAIRSSPGDDLVFEETVGIAIRLVREMRANGADIVILAVHERREIDNALIAESGADIILSGDDHDLLVGFNGKVAFAEAMQDGLYLTAVDVEASASEKDGKRKVKWWPNFRIIDPSTAEPDPTVAARVAEYAKELSAELDVAIGRTETELDSRNAAVRGGEAVIGNLYADAIRIQTGAEISILNGGGLRANRVYPAGSEITRRDVLAELPFGNFTYVLEISGANLKQALEQGLARAENLTGGFPQVSNMTVRADVTKPVGDRVTAVTIGGEPLDENRLYRLATNDFLARGGDG
ncbi:MAG: 5'-nucleotidase C-terminal domain-containing protein, partial [Hyphomicrobiales bacterium]|nr:5'-nucleotidase C-terminal domain-containing protein [Hyphomicrobiales bacterium]